MKFEFRDYSGKFKSLICSYRPMDIFIDDPRSRKIVIFRH